MIAFEAAGLYIGLNIFLMVYLAFRVVGERLRTKTSIGDGGHPALALAIRVHANATEYVPVAVGALIALALLDAPLWAIHAAGGTFTLARLAHAIGFGGGILIGRQLGTMLTWLSLIAMAGGLVFLAVT